MKKFLFSFALLFIASHVYADSVAKDDPKIGKTLADKSCNTCHVSMYGGDGSKIYTRPERKATNAQQLLTRVRACNVNVGANWFPEDEMHVAAYLNQTYYHFK